MVPVERCPSCSRVSTLYDECGLSGSFSDFAFDHEARGGSDSQGTGRGGGDGLSGKLEAARRHAFQPFGRWARGSEETRPLPSQYPCSSSDGDAALGLCCRPSGEPVFLGHPSPALHLFCRAETFLPLVAFSLAQCQTPASVAQGRGLCLQVFFAVGLLWPELALFSVGLGF